MAAKIHKAHQVEAKIPHWHVVEQIGFDVHPVPVAYKAVAIIPDAPIPTECIQSSNIGLHHPANSQQVILHALLFNPAGRRDLGQCQQEQ